MIRPDPTIEALLRDTARELHDAVRAERKARTRLYHAILIALQNRQINIADASRLTGIHRDTIRRLLKARAR